MNQTKLSLTIVIVFLAVCCNRLPANPAQMVADINGGKTTSDADPSQFAEHDGNIYFRGYHPDTGHELWKSDGTADGTALMADYVVGPDSSDPKKLVSRDNYLYYLASNENGISQLFRSDGTAAGTIQLLKGDAFSNITNFFFASNGSLYLEANDSNHRYRLLLYNHSTGRASMLKEITGRTVTVRTTFLGNIGPLTLFTCEDATYGREIWRTDGTAAGTQLVKDQLPGSRAHDIYGAVELNGKLYYTLFDGLWRTDGTEAGTAQVKAATTWTEPAKAGSIIYFGANNGIAGNSLWRSDGTSAGTVAYAPAKGLNQRPFVSINGLVYYVASSSTNSPELWRSDGSVAGTIQLTNFNTPGDTVPTELTAVGNRLFFRSFHDGDLYVSDGTVASTTLVRKFEREVSQTWDHWPTAAYGASVVFAAEGGSGRDLWISDGTSEGTRLVYEPELGIASDPSGLLHVDGKWFFHANDGVNGREPWVSDGTPEGTFFLRDVATGPADSIVEDAVFTELNGKVYFTADDQIHGRELWVSDGTQGGTQLVLDINPGYNWSSPYQIFSSGGRLFFVARTVDSGSEIWVSDGTTPGTRMIANIFQSPQEPVPIAAVDGEVYFMGTYFQSGGSTVFNDTFWKSDGTDAGTVQLKQFDDSHHSFLPSQIPAVVNGLVFFARTTINYGNDLWVSDGTSAGTRRIGDNNLPGGLSSPQHLTPAGGFLYFSASQNGDTELWKSDGTPGGTELVRDITFGYSSFPEALTQVDGRLMFSVPFSGQKGLWETDGSLYGTRKVHPNPPINTVAVGTDLLYSADDELYGRELWLSSGRRGRTAMVQDINPSASSHPQQFAPGVERVLFTADDGVHGQELWSLSINNMWPAAAAGWELYE